MASLRGCDFDASAIPYPMAPAIKSSINPFYNCAGKTIKSGGPFLAEQYDYYIDSSSAD